VLSLTKTCVVITGMEVLLEMLTSFTNPKQQCDGALALCTLAKKATALSPIDVAPLPPTPQVYLGEQYVNSSTLSDVTFLVEGVILCTALLLNSYQYSLMVAKVA
jgi:hypothetical protein